MSEINSTETTITLTESTHEPPGRGERADAVANRALILETADALFAAQGVANVNMAEIAKTAGVGKGTLYRRFANKGELCLALMDTQMRTFQETMLVRMREMSAQSVPALDQLAAFLDALVLFTDQHYPLLCEVQQHRDALDEIGVARPHFWQYMTVRGLLEKARQEGSLPADADTPFLAEALLAPLTASLFRYQLNHLGFSLARISAGLQTIISGLGNS
jgi:AcrR family transcriptional regulator